MNLAYYRWPLIILGIGLFIRIIGFLMTILHWQGADYVYLGGLIILGIGVLALIIRAYTGKKANT